MLIMRCPSGIIGMKKRMEAGSELEKIDGLIVMKLEFFYDMSSLKKPELNMFQI